MIPDGVIDDKSWAILTQLTEPYPNETIATANAKHNLAPDENWTLFPDMLAIQPASSPNGVDSNDGNRGPHFRWDGTIEGASQPREYYAYSSEEHITWEQGLEIIEEFDWSMPEAQQSDDVEISEPVAAPLVDANTFETQKDGPARDSQARLPCLITEAEELGEEITAKPAATDAATTPTIPFAPSGASDNTAAPEAPLPEPSTVVTVEAEQPRIHLADVDEAAKDETALADQLEREMAQNSEIPAIEVEADTVQSYDRACTIIKDTTQEAQETSLKATSQQQSLPEVILELPEQDLPNAPSDTEQVAHHETEAEQWEEQLQAAAAEEILHLVAEPESLDIIDVGKLDDEPKLEQDGCESPRDTVNEVCSANTNERKRSKAINGAQSSDTEAEAPVKKKARTRSPTPSDNANQIKDEPYHEAEASATAPIPRTSKSTSRKSIKESPKEVPAAQDQIMFTEPLQPPEVTIATLDNAKGTIHPPPTDSDHDMQEHLTDATNSPTHASVSLSQSQRAPRNIVSSRELQALGSTLMPGMHLGLHLRAESRPARTKRSVDTPVQSANKDDGNAFLIDEGTDEEDSEGEMKKARKKKKRPSAATGRKTPAKKSKKETIGGGSRASRAAGMNGDQRRPINGHDEDQEMEEEVEEIHDLFPAPKIDKATDPNAPSNATPPNPKSIPRRTPAPSTKKPTPRAPQNKPNNEPTDADEDENDTDELAPSPQHASRQRKRADDDDEEYIDPFPAKLAPTPSSTSAPATQKSTKKTKTNPRTTQVKATPTRRSNSPMVAIAVKQSPVAKAVSSPVVRNKFGFSPRKTMASVAGATPVAKGAGAKGKGKGEGKSTTKSTGAAKGGLKIKNEGEDGTVVQAKHAAQGTEPDRRVTRRASTIALEIAATGDGSPTAAPAAKSEANGGGAKSKGRTIPTEGVQGEKDGPKTRRAVGVMGEEKDKEMEKQLEMETEKEEGIGKRLRSKS